jgi:hypothetical protein
VQGQVARAEAIAGDPQLPLCRLPIHRDGSDWHREDFAGLPVSGLGCSGQTR